MLIPAPSICCSETLFFPIDWQFSTEFLMVFHRKGRLGVDRRIRPVALASAGLPACLPVEEGAQ